MWMIDKDKRFTFNEAGAAVDRSSDLLTAIVDHWEDPGFRQAALGRKSGWLQNIAPEVRENLQILMGHYSDAVARYAQAQSIIEETWKLYFMARKYPWHGTPITKSDHLHFVWLSFTHHCYLFEERVKKFYADWNALRRLTNLQEVEGGSHIKQISNRLAEYIKHRGAHTHQGNVIHNSYKTYQLVEFLQSHTDGNYEERARDFYLESKVEIKHHIASGVGVMAEEFLSLRGRPQQELKSLVTTICDAYFSQP